MQSTPALRVCSIITRLFDRILALLLINLQRRAARRPVTKLKEPHKWPRAGVSPCTGLHIDSQRLKKAYHIKPRHATKVARSMHESFFQSGASTFKYSDSKPKPPGINGEGIDVRMRCAGTLLTRESPPLVSESLRTREGGSDGCLPLVLCSSV